MDKLFIVYSLEGDPYDSIVGLFQAEDIEKVKEYLYKENYIIQPYSEGSDIMIEEIKAIKI